MTLFQFVNFDSILNNNSDYDASKLMNTLNNIYFNNLF